MLFRSHVVAAVIGGLTICQAFTPPATISIRPTTPIARSTCLLLQESTSDPDELKKAMLRNPSQSKDLIIFQIYEEWRGKYNKGEFDPYRFMEFKTNYMKIQTNYERLVAIAKMARKPPPPPPQDSLNEYADLTKAEYHRLVKESSSTSTSEEEEESRPEVPKAASSSTPKTKIPSTKGPTNPSGSKSTVSSTTPSSSDVGTVLPHRPIRPGSLGNQSQKNSQQVNALKQAMLRNPSQSNDIMIYQLYEEWRQKYNKGEFDTNRFMEFKSNYLLLKKNHELAVIMAKKERRPPPPFPEIHEYADLTKAEYHRVLQQQDQSKEQPSAQDDGDKSPTSKTKSSSDTDAKDALKKAILRNPSQSKDIVMYQIYEEWRKKHNKGEFDTHRFMEFKTNYMRMQKNYQAAVSMAMKERLPLPPPPEISDHADMTPAEYHRSLQQAKAEQENKEGEEENEVTPKAEETKEAQDVIVWSSEAKPSMNKKSSSLREPYVSRSKHAAKASPPIKVPVRSKRDQTPPSRQDSSARTRSRVEPSDGSRTTPAPIRPDNQEIRNPVTWRSIPVRSAVSKGSSSLTVDNRGPDADRMAIDFPERQGPSGKRKSPRLGISDQETKIPTKTVDPSSSYAAHNKVDLKKMPDVPGISDQETKLPPKRVSTENYTQAPKSTSTNSGVSYGSGVSSDQDTKLPPKRVNPDYYSQAPKQRKVERNKAGVSDQETQALSTDLDPSASYRGDNKKDLQKMPSVPKKDFGKTDSDDFSPALKETTIPGISDQETWSLPNDLDPSASYSGDNKKGLRKMASVPRRESTDSLSPEPVDNYFYSKTPGEQRVTKSVSDRETWSLPDDLDPSASYRGDNQKDLRKMAPVPLKVSTNDPMDTEDSNGEGLKRNIPGISDQETRVMSTDLDPSASYSGDNKKDLRKMAAIPRREFTDSLSPESVITEYNPKGSVATKVATGVSDEGTWSSAKSLDPSASYSGDNKKDLRKMAAVPLKGSFGSLSREPVDIDYYSQAPKEETRKRFTPGVSDQETRSPSNDLDPSASYSGDNKKELRKMAAVPLRGSFGSMSRKPVDPDYYSQAPKDRNGAPSNNLDPSASYSGDNKKDLRKMAAVPIRGSDGSLSRKRIDSVGPYPREMKKARYSSVSDQDRGPSQSAVVDPEAYTQGRERPPTNVVPTMQGTPKSVGTKKPSFRVDPESLTDTPPEGEINEEIGKPSFISPDQKARAPSNRIDPDSIHAKHWPL